MKQVSKLAVLGLAVALSATGCAQIDRSGTYSQQGHTQRADRVEMGTVTHATDITIQGNHRGAVGAGAGALIGGLLGSKVGGGSGQKVATVVGGIAGGVAGQHVEQRMANRAGQELTIQLDSGKYVSVTQQSTDQYFQPGERVRVIRGGVTRVLK